MKEARIKTKFGEICISYQNTEQLKEELEGLEEQINIVQETTDRVDLPSSRTVKPGYESFYRFSPSGKLELLRTHKYQNATVALVLFAYHPDPVSLEDLKSFTGITNVASLVLTVPQNKKYFEKVGNKYKLTYDGLAMVTERFSKVIEQQNKSDEMEDEVAGAEEGS